MTVQQMFNSLPILQRMMELKLPISKAYRIYGLIKTINNEREFFIEKERALIEQYEAEILENGNIKFKNAETQAQFSRDHAELMSCELDLPVVELKIEDLGSIEFSPMEFVLLEGAIAWVE